MTTHVLSRYLIPISRKLLSPVNLIGGILLVVLSYLIVVPLIQLVWRTLVWGTGDRRFSRDAVEGEFTLFHWNETLTGNLSVNMLYEPLVNTMVTGVLSALLALVLGALLAWTVVRTDMPGRSFLRPVLTVPYVVPSFAIALAWVTVFKSPRDGGQPGLWQALFDSAPPEWLSYGPVPIILTGWLTCRTICISAKSQWSERTTLIQEYHGCCPHIARRCLRAHSCNLEFVCSTFVWMLSVLGSTVHRWFFRQLMASFNSRLTSMMCLMTA